MAKLDLDVDSPEKVAPVLLAAAEAYQTSAGELIAAWQDKGAGASWAKISTILERAAAQIEKALT